MWSRAELKDKAKINLKRYYWLAFAVCLVAGILSGVGTAGGRGNSGGYTNSIRNDFYSGEGVNVIGEKISQEIIRILPTFLMFISLFMIIGILLLIFVSGPVEAGKKYFFLHSRENGNVPKFMNMFFNFGQGRYMNTVTVMFFRGLYTFLWSLLFIIPGIIKSYEYFMIPYIVAENPDIDKNRAFELSKYMTDGDKFNIFILQLSFIGWYFLGALLFGLGVFFVPPYVEATIAELYAVKREEAIRSGFANKAELSGFSDHMNYI